MVKLNEKSKSNLLVEMARINTKDRGIFPFDDYEVKIWSNSHNPPHFHIIKNGWDVTFSIENGEVLNIKSKGDKMQIYKYMTDNVVKWLSSPCAILSAVSNQDNAMAVWSQLHDEGLKIIGSSTTEFGAKQVCPCSATLVDYPTVDEPIRNDLLKSSGRLKQEVNNEQV